MLFNTAYLFLGLITAACAAPLVVDTIDIHARSPAPPEFNLVVTPPPGPEAPKSEFKVEFTEPPKEHGHSLKPASDAHPTPQAIQEKAAKLITAFFATTDKAVFGLPKNAKPDVGKYPFTELPPTPEVWYKYVKDKDVYTGSVIQTKKSVFSEGVYKNGVEI